MCIRLCLSESLIVNISLINIIEIQVKLKISEIKNLTFLVIIILTIILVHISTVVQFKCVQQ